MLKISECSVELPGVLLNPIELGNYTQLPLNRKNTAIRCNVNEDSIDIGFVNESLQTPSPWSYRERDYENNRRFNVAFIIPTGVGASLGGHAGDANPVLKAICQVADHVFTHPNVVNASDLNEIPFNADYVEGSILSRLLMGTVGLRPVRSNRVLVLYGDHPEKKYVHSAINAVNAARATFGMKLAGLESIGNLKMTATVSSSGRASGVVENLGHIKEILSIYKGKYDAVAITSIVDMDRDVLYKYYASQEDRINPIGGVEALLTHWVSSLTDKPSAHAPMMENTELDNEDFGVVDARLAAELISFTYFSCVLKGLMKSPEITKDLEEVGAFTARNVNAIVMPKGCLGIPTYAALIQGIPVIAVEDNIQSDRSDEFIKTLPWKDGQYIEADNYKEAIGILVAMKAGLSIESISRPIKTVGTDK